MELSKLQTVALVVLTTILTDKFLINHSYNNSNVSNQAIVSPTPQISSTPNVQVSPSVSASQNEVILKELQALNQKINNTPVPTKEPIPTTTNSPLIGGMVKINSPQWTRLDVFEKASASSKIINSIVYDTIYFYASKSNGWYQLNLDGGQIGWVQAQFLKEYP